MDRQQLDRAVPFVYAAAIIVCALWIHVALVPVAIVGGLLVAFYYAVARPKSIKRASGSKHE